MCIYSIFYKGSMGACATQQEIFDEIEKSDDKPPVSVSPVGTKSSEDTPGKKSFSNLNMCSFYKSHK